MAIFSPPLAQAGIFCFGVSNHLLSPRATTLKPARNEFFDAIRSEVAPAVFILDEREPKKLAYERWAENLTNFDISEPPDGIPCTVIVRIIGYKIYVYHYIAWHPASPFCYASCSMSSNMCSTDSLSSTMHVCGPRGIVPLS